MELKVAQVIVELKDKLFLENTRKGFFHDQVSVKDLFENEQWIAIKFTQIFTTSSKGVEIGDVVEPEIEFIEDKGDGKLIKLSFFFYNKVTKHIYYNCNKEPFLKVIESILGISIQDGVDINIPIDALYSVESITISRDETPQQTLLSSEYRHEKDVSEIAGVETMTSSELTFNYVKNTPIKKTKLKQYLDKIEFDGKITFRMKGYDQYGNPLRYFNGLQRRIVLFESIVSINILNAYTLKELIDLIEQEERRDGNKIINKKDNRHP